MRVWEEGGELLFIAQPAEREVGSATISGIVYDSVRERPLAGATVFLVDAGLVTVSDQNGAFHIPNLVPGRHRVAFVHARSDSLGLRVQPIEVAARAGEIVRVTLGISRESGCADDGQDEFGRTGISGFVVDALDGRGIAGARVTASWRSRTSWREGFAGQQRSSASVTGEDGRFLFCGFHTGEEVRLTATMSGSRTSEDVKIGREGLVHQNLVVR